MMDSSISTATSNCASCAQHQFTSTVSSVSSASNLHSQQRPLLTLDSTTRLNSAVTMTTQSFLDQGSIGSGPNNTSTTPIRPRPILPSLSYSFDSGYEVSPICLRSFAYGDEQNGSQQLGHGTTGQNLSPVSIRKHSQDLVDEAVEMSSFDEDRDDESANDSIVGYDKELISIEQHFTPITSPNFSTNIADAGHASDVNLANQRRTNRSQRHLSEANNNDVFFPNQNPPLSQQDQSMFDEMFLLDEGDDDVFLSEEEMEEEQNDDSNDVVEPRLWHLHRPSCIISETEPELDSGRNQAGLSQPAPADYNRNWLRRHVRLQSEDSLQTASSSGSRRSSTPIPIPGSTSSSGSTSLSDQELFDELDSGGQFLFDPSVPSGTRMPYYHRMAPPLNRQSDSSLLGSSDSSSSDSTENRHLASQALRRANQSNGTNTFGTRFETSCSIISRNMIPPSRYSPPPLPFFNWHHNVNRLNRSGSPFLLQFGRLSPTALAGQSPQQAAYRFIPNDFRVLSPHFEADEYNQPANDVDMAAAAAASLSTSSSSYGLIFNFSQFDSQLDGTGDVEANNNLVGLSTIEDNVAQDIRRQRRTLLVDNRDVLAEETEDEEEEVVVETRALVQNSQIEQSSFGWDNPSSSYTTSSRAQLLSQPSAPSFASPSSSSSTSSFSHSTTADLNSATASTTATMSIDLDIVPKIERRRRRQRHYSGADNGPILECSNGCQTIQSNCPLPDVIATADPNFRSHQQPPVSPSHYRRTTINNPSSDGGGGSGQWQPPRNHRIIKHRNTLPSFHEVPSSCCSVSTENQENLCGNVTVGCPKNRQNGRNSGGAEPRRTMSVSLPIDERTIRTVAGQLRRISDDFSLQVQRHNPLVLRSLLDLLVNHFMNSFQSNASAAAAAVSAASVPPTNNARNLRPNPRTNVSTAPRPSTVPTPTTTGNSTFYLGSSTTTTTVKSKLDHFDPSPPPN